MLGFFFGCGFGALRQTSQQGLILDQHLRLFGIRLCHHVLSELKTQQRQLLVDLFETLFLIRR